MPKGSTQEKLDKVLNARPWLKDENHQLNTLVQLVQDTLAAGTRDPDPEDLLQRLDAQAQAEDKTLEAAFSRFDHSKKGQLSRKDVEHMSKYLGFPHAKADIDKLMDAIDKDKSGKVKKNEFFDYVRKMGGTEKLFEERRRRITEAGGFSEGDPEEAKLAIKEAGIDEEAQAYWRLVVSPTEFQEAGKLTSCQKKAVALIRKLAKTNHERDLPKVQKRITGLRDDRGQPFKEEHLWMTLAWIRELAPVIVHVNMDKMLQFMEKDSHYRNQFETASSGGLLKPAVREKWERDLFGGAYDKATGFERPKYGVLNVMNDYRGVVKCKQYGDSYVILKDARLRCTFSPEDSANLKSERLAVLDFYAHVLNEYSDDELRETLKVANSAEAAVLGDSDRVGNMKYKEAQIHGEVCFAKHVDRLVVNEKHKIHKEMGERIERMCKKHGWNWGWRDAERKRMKEQSCAAMEPKTFEERLKLLQESDVVVEEGFCKVGCGRRVQPGVTRANRPFDTCCKGCVMGFGHDLLCGKVDPSKVGPGLCKHGCGRKVAPGRDPAGRPLDTCCKACAEGARRGEVGVHDETCGQAVSSFAPSDRGAQERPVCRTPGCSRLVAPGKQASGRPWANCCRGCATGGEHSATCLEEYPQGSPNADGSTSGSEFVVPPVTSSRCTPVAPEAADLRPAPEAAAADRPVKECCSVS